MALELSKEFSSGAVGNYWRISDLNCNPVNKVLTIVVSCYKDQASKIAGKSSMATETLIFADSAPLVDGPYPASQLLLDNVLTVGYNLVKTQDYFQGAIDV